jgi:hypothetical protein
VKESHGWRKHLDDKQSESPSSYSTLMYNDNDIPCNGKNCLQSYLISSSLKRKEKTFFHLGKKLREPYQNM